MCYLYFTYYKAVGMRNGTKTIHITILDGVTTFKWAEKMH